MKSISFILIPLILLASIVGCATGSTGDSSSTTSPENTVREFLQALESGNIDKAQNYWTQRPADESEDFYESMKLMSSIDMYNENIRVVTHDEAEGKAVVEVDLDARVTIGDETDVVHMVVDYELVFLDEKWLINNSFIVE